jgi:hypothetical protein
MDFNGLRHSSDWCRKEFEKIDLGDKRLDERFIKTAEMMFASPESSINQACIGWPETKGAYRLFDNDKVDPGEIIFSHQEALRERLQNQKLVLALQDTVYFNFDAQPDGYAILSKKKFTGMNGIVMHHALAVTPQGLPLGVLSQELYHRASGTCRKDHYDHQNIPFEDKESYRWVSALRESLKFENSKLRIVTIADRECDIYEFMHEATQLHSSYVIRAAKDRALWNGKNKNETEAKIWNVVRGARICGNYDVNVPKKKNRKARSAKVSVQYTLITLRPPYRRPNAKAELLDPVTVTAILVTEKNPPRKEEPIEWMLLTDLRIENFTQAMEKIAWYQTRWQIECYHKTMKSGFKVEFCRLQTIPRLYRFISLISVLAVRLQAFTHEARLHGDQNCEQILSADEWQALYVKKIVVIKFHPSRRI